MRDAAGEARANGTVLDTMKATLGRREQDQFEDWKSGHRNADWREILDQRDELRDGASKKPDKDEITTLKAENESLKERIRTGKGPDLTPKGGGSTDLNKARQDYAEGKISTSEAERLGIVK